MEQKTKMNVFYDNIIQDRDAVIDQLDITKMPILTRSFRRRRTIIKETTERVIAGSHNHPKNLKGPVYIFCRDEVNPDSAREINSTAKGEMDITNAVNATRKVKFS